MYGGLSRRSQWPLGCSPAFGCMGRMRIHRSIHTHSFQAVDKFTVPRARTAESAGPCMMWHGSMAVWHWPVAATAASRRRGVRACDVGERGWPAPAPPPVRRLPRHFPRYSYRSSVRAAEAGGPTLHTRRVEPRKGAHTAAALCGRSARVRPVADGGRTGWGRGGGRRRRRQWRRWDRVGGSGACD
jgi:hypothetical protein